MLKGINIGQHPAERFNILVVGPGNVGKKSLIYSLLSKFVSEGSLGGNDMAIANKNEYHDRKVHIKQYDFFQTASDSGSLHLHLYCTTGYDDFIDNTSSVEDVLQDLRKRHVHWQSLDNNQLSEIDRLMLDTRIHCLLYLVGSAGMKEIDENFMSQVSGIVPIVPIFYKVDALDVQAISESIKIMENNIRSVSLNKAAINDWCCYDFQNFCEDYTFASTYNFGECTATPDYDTLHAHVIGNFELPCTPKCSNGFWGASQIQALAHVQTTTEQFVETAGTQSGFCLIDDPITTKPTITTQGDESVELTGKAEKRHLSVPNTLESPRAHESSVGLGNCNDVNDLINHPALYASTSGAAKSILLGDLENEMNRLGCSKMQMNSPLPVYSPCSTPFPYNPKGSTVFSEATKLSNIFAITSNDLNQTNACGAKVIDTDKQSDFHRLQFLLFEEGIHFRNMKKLTQEISMKLYEQGKRVKHDKNDLMRYIKLPSIGSRSTFAWLLMAAAMMALIGFKSQHSHNKQSSRK